MVNETKAPALDVKVLAKAPPALRRRSASAVAFRSQGSARRLETFTFWRLRRLFGRQRRRASGGNTGGGRVTRHRNRLVFEFENN